MHPRGRGTRSHDRLGLFRRLGSRAEPPEDVTRDTDWLVARERASLAINRLLEHANSTSQPTIEGVASPWWERGANPEGGMMELTPAELSYVRSQGLHLTCRLPGFVTILAAINDKARHHSKQDPTC